MAATCSAGLPFDGSAPKVGVSPKNNQIDVAATKQIILFITFYVAYLLITRIDLRPSLFDARQNTRPHSPLRLRALRATVVQTDAHRAGFHVATADDQHRVDAQLFRVGNLRLEWRRAEIRIHAHHV